MEMPKSGEPQARLAAFEGRWEGKSLIFRNESPRGHGRYTHTIEEDRYSFKLEVSAGGETWGPMMEGHDQRA